MIWRATFTPACPSAIATVPSAPALAPAPSYPPCLIDLSRTRHSRSYCLVVETPLHESVPHFVGTKTISHALQRVAFSYFHGATIANYGSAATISWKPFRILVTLYVVCFKPWACQHPANSHNDSLRDRPATPTLGEPSRLSLSPHFSSRARRLIPVTISPMEPNVSRPSDFSRCPL